MRRGDAPCCEECADEASVCVEGLYYCCVHSPLQDDELSEDFG